LSVLKNQQKVFIDSDKLGVIEKLEEIKEELSFDEELYERFRSLRKELASNHEVPAYVIFGDKTLKELTQKLPTTKEQMLEINGVGEVKFEKYGEPFLELTSKLKEEFSKELENRPTLKKLTKTYLETLDLIQEGKNLEEISQIRDLNLTSVLSHITVLEQHDKISKEKKLQLLEPIKIPKEIGLWIQQGLQLDSLKQLRQHLYLYEYLKKAEDEL